MGVGRRSRRGEAEPRASASGANSLVEWLEDDLLLLRRDPGPAVQHFDLEDRHSFHRTDLGDEVNG